MMLVSLSSFANGDKVVDAHNLKEGAMEGCYLPPHITCNALDAAYDLSWEQIDEVNARAEEVYASCRNEGLDHAQAYSIASQRIFDMMDRLGIHMSYF